ncbi:MAG TPA: c-type cytochrome, partial [Chitinophagaceae bacterium]|nr:c-type cytochrome [Chitinophagaceae bacterium]
IYQSDAFPASEKGRIFMANIHEHGVLSDVLQQKGSGFTASHADDFMMANNAQWVGFSMEVGPEGGVYVLDWHDADICGQKVLNTETGRIFRIVPEKSGAENFPGRYSDLNKMQDAELVALQTNSSDWHARRARIILQSRAAKGKLDSKTHSQLLTIFETNTNADWRLRAMWALHITKGLSQSTLSKALLDKDQYIRAWAIQLLCEDGPTSQAISAKLTTMAASDPSPVVRLYLASALQRLDKNTSWKIAAELVKHSEDINDHNLPKMIWFGLEPLAATDPARALSIASKANIPLLAQYTARRAVDAGATNELIKQIGAQPKTLISLMEGMINGMEGRTDLKPPSNWQAVFNTLKKRNDKGAQLAVEIAELFGDTQAAQRSLVTLKNKNAAPLQRKKALAALTAQQRKELLTELPALLEDQQMRIEAIRSVAAFDDEKLGALLIRKYDAFNPVEKTAAIQTLSSRPRYGWALTQAIKNERVPKNEIPANVARQLRRVVGSGFVEVWGPIDDTPFDQGDFTKYKTLVSNNAASPNSKNGQALFQKTCGSCHKMYGQGGNIGPDLTGSNRSNVDYLLFNILSPSEEIQDAYKMVVITTRDGRSYSGNIIGENQRQLTMRVVGQDAVVINKSSIQSKEITPVSMMPQGLLSTLTEKEVVDLIAYIRTAGK